MSDHELSTRDLAGTTGEQEPSNQQIEEPTDAADEPMTSERSESEAQAAEPDSKDQEQEPLLSADKSESFARQWHEIQVAFVDEPRDSVAQADTLVADLMQQLAASFSEERERLEKQWDSGDDVSTEDLRVALTRYRSFFDRLLSA
jgi:hypothetical protein